MYLSNIHLSAFVLGRYVIDAQVSEGPVHTQERVHEVYSKTSKVQPFPHRETIVKRRKCAKEVFFKVKASVS